ncbi:hypothetical protein [Paraburkholderia sp. SIMBA_054]|uniref:hypothetical protein n=1 Tax=Paraburkholderia sp. SIMBA_054 TaxID=3085795 RepID=UPI00397A6AE0
MSDLQDAMLLFTRMVTQIKRDRTLALSVFLRRVAVVEGNRAKWVVAKYLLVAERGGALGEIVSRISNNFAQEARTQSLPRSQGHVGAPLSESLQCASLIVAEACARVVAVAGGYHGQCMAMATVDGVPVPVCCQIVTETEAAFVAARALLEPGSPQVVKIWVDEASSSVVQRFETDERFRHFMEKLMPGEPGGAIDGSQPS